MKKLFVTSLLLVMGCGPTHLLSGDIEYKKLDEYQDLGKTFCFTHDQLMDLNAKRFYGLPITYLNHRVFGDMRGYNANDPNRDKILYIKAGTPVTIISAFDQIPHGDIAAHRDARSLVEMKTSEYRLISERGYYEQSAKKPCNPGPGDYKPALKKR